MGAFSFLASVFLLVSLVGASQEHHHDRCVPIVRKEWRTLTHIEQHHYLRAVQCILTKPPLTNTTQVPGAGSRFDDFVATHIEQTFSIHYVGHFLAWHRWFTAAYEYALRNECGYEGAQPYWDWTLDVTPMEKFVQSPVFDPVFGFGGNGPFIATNTSDPFYVPGRTGGGCVQDGPFRNMTVRLGPASSLALNPRCLSRDFSPLFASEFLNKNITEHTISQPDFGWFDRVVEGEPSFSGSGVHGGGHYSVGGTLGIMGDLYVSPGDPIFYMHHANLDRVWWSWQSMNLSSRLTDISGPINILDYTNSVGGNVTLAFPMSLGVNWKHGQNTTVGQVMDIRGTAGIGGILCYTYDHLYTLPPGHHHGTSHHGSNGWSSNGGSGHGMPGMSGHGASGHGSSGSEHGSSGSEHGSSGSEHGSSGSGHGSGHGSSSH